MIVSRHGRPLRICIVTWAHVCNNPRVVKEADALSAAGHDVRVVAHSVDELFDARDAELLLTRRWALRTVATSRRLRTGRRLALRGAQTAARVAFDAGVRTGQVRDLALNPQGAELARVAAAEPADLVIGHNLRALPAAVWAAESLGGAAGFDFEDLHSAEMPDSPAFARERTLALGVERAYAPRCAFLTASSPGIADEVERRHDVRRPKVVLNAFSLAERTPTGRVARDRRGGPFSLYWFSQVVGPGRGIEEAVVATGRLGFPVELHLRGAVIPEFAERVRSLADEHGMGERLVIHPPAPPGELVPLAGEHDVGLALEQPTSLNRELCATNKIFTYLVAGLAVAATDTRGQRDVMAEAPGAGFLYPAGDPDALAQELRILLSSPGRLTEAKRAALAAAERRLCWEREAPALVAFLEGEPNDSSQAAARCRAALVD